MRTIKLHNCTVEFDEESLIQFYDGYELVLQIDPNDLSVIYGAYRQMVREEEE